MQTIVYKTDKQQSPLWHRGRHSISCNKPLWKRISEYICTLLSHFAVYKKLTQHYKKNTHTQKKKQHTQNNCLYAVCKIPKYSVCRSNRLTFKFSYFEFVFLVHYASGAQTCKVRPETDWVLLRE